MNIADYIVPLRKWWWLILATVVVATVSSLIYSLNQPPTYQVRTTLMVGNTLNAPNPNGGDFYLQQQLAGIYADIAFREPIVQAVSQSLGLEQLPEYSVRALPNSTLIEIVVTDISPERTMLVARELANQLVNSSPGLAGDDSSAQNFLQEQLDIVRIQINEARTELEDQQAQLLKLTSARQIENAQTQIRTLQSRLNDLQATYASLLSNTRVGATNALTIIEQAELPLWPIGPNKAMAGILAAGVGLALAVVAAYAMEYLDDSVKSAEDVKRVLGAPVLGYISEFPKGNNTWTYIQEQPRSPLAHSFRMLRTNLDLLVPDKRLGTILVTSASTSEGKSTIAMNLAVVMAQSDRKVVCIDADFHRPVLHNALEIANPLGFSGVIKEEVALEDAYIPWKPSSLRVIPAGVISDNPTELLGSDRVDELLTEIQKTCEHVIIDAPPFFLSDTSILCTKVDCVLLVVRMGYTRKEALKAIKEQIDNLHIKQLVVVINRVAKQDSYYSKYYPKEYNHKPETFEN